MSFEVGDRVIYKGVRATVAKVHDGELMLDFDDKAPVEFEADYNGWQPIDPRRCKPLGVVERLAELA
jgi:hypothetical protein